MTESGSNLASVWEAVAHAVPEQPAVACGEIVRTWAEFEGRAARLAGALGELDVGREVKVGLALFNGNEYLESEFAILKRRAIPLNVNYRYGTTELAQLLTNGDAEVLVYDRTRRDAVAPLLAAVPTLRVAIEVGEDPSPPWAQGYESLVAGSEPAEPVERSGDDLWFLYTGGTTGQPRAVMYTHHTLLAAMGQTFRELGIDGPLEGPSAYGRAARDVAERDDAQTLLAGSPLMHGTAGIGAKRVLSHGGCVVTLARRSFDPHEVWRAVARHRVTLLTIVGDAFSRPLIEALRVAREEGVEHDLSTLRTIVSSGATWSDAAKTGLLEFVDATLVDALGSSETSSFMGAQVSSRRRRVPAGRFRLGPQAQVFDDHDRPVPAGSGGVGWLALGGDLPLGYYKDPDTSARTFRVIDGQRWSIPGDLARVDEDGMIVLLGRRSKCINTAGEKVFPDEVEQALRAHPEVADCLVVGAADDQWGQSVVALVEPAPGAQRLDDGELIAHCRASLAGYKCPKRVVAVERIERLANGKPNYPWAERLVAEPARTV